MLMHTWLGKNTASKFTFLCFGQLCWLQCFFIAKVDERQFSVASRAPAGLSSVFHFPSWWWMRGYHVCWLFCKWCWCPSFDSWKFFFKIWDQLQATTVKGCIQVNALPCWYHSHKFWFIYFLVVVNLMWPTLLHGMAIRYGSQRQPPSQMYTKQCLCLMSNVFLLKNHHGKETLQKCRNEEMAANCLFTFEKTGREDM